MHTKIFLLIVESILSDDKIPVLSISEYLTIYSLLLLKYVEKANSLLNPFKSQILSNIEVNVLTIFISYLLF
jgi:hypothetical protein